MEDSEDMKEVITVMNQLQDAFNLSGLRMDLQLPQIAVVGGQSAGKSSVLETFVQKEFLPRGNGIVTRCPIVLQLHPSKNQKEYAELLHATGETVTFENLNTLKRELEKETDRVAGPNKGISSQPITLRIHSPNVLDLTLVDLPGLTKVPVENQPEDIGRQVEDLVMEYIAQDNTLILAVSPANQDLANSDSLMMARQVDPAGDRTIGVITKLDLMDQGTSAKSTLENKVYPLKRGYVGVVNRSQRDIDNNTELRITRKKETEFFENHPSYRHIADKQGSAYLQMSLHRQLKKHIATKLPGLKAKLLKQYNDVKEEITELGADKVDEDTIDGLTKVIEKFKQSVCASIEGQTTSVSKRNVEGGAHINLTFYHTIYELLDQITPPSKEEIAIAVTNLHGFRNAMFVPQQAFDVTVRELVQRYKEPVKQATHVIANILNEIVEKKANVLSMYPLLQQQVLFLMTGHIQRQQDEAQRTLLTYLEAECSFMNTKHPEMHVTHIHYSDNLLKQEMPPQTLGTPSTKRRPFSIAPQPTLHDDRDTIEHKGWLTNKSSRLQRSKDYWFVLNNTFLTAYQNERETDEKYRISLSKLVCKITKERRTGFSKMTLSRLDQLPVYKDHKIVQLELRNNYSAEIDYWMENLRKAGVTVEDQGSSSSLTSLCNGGDTRNGSTTQTVNVAKPEWKKILESNPVLQHECTALSTMVECYMKIINKTVHDLTPKFLSLLMVQEMLKYVSMELLGKLLKAGIPVEEYLKLSGDHATQIQKRKKVLDVTEQAIKILDDASFTR